MPGPCVLLDGSLCFALCALRSSLCACSVFTLVGVQLNLPILRQSIAFGILVFLARAGCIAAGSYIGGTLAGLDLEKRKGLWMTMLAQAGVSLGLAAEVAVKFPEWGSKFQTTSQSRAVAGKREKGAV